MSCDGLSTFSYKNYLKIYYCSVAQQKIKCFLFVCFRIAFLHSLPKHILNWAIHLFISYLYIHMTNKEIKLFQGTTKISTWALCPPLLVNRVRLLVIQLKLKCWFKILCNVFMAKIDSILNHLKVWRLSEKYNQIQGKTNRCNTS